MPNRILRDGILTSHRIHRLDVYANLFYYKLISAVDDFGRYLGSPTALRVATFPLKAAEFTDEQVIGWLEQCCAVDLIQTYSVDDIQYIELKEFKQRMRDGAKSKYPAPPQMRGQSAAEKPRDDGGFAANPPLNDRESAVISRFFRGSRAQAPASSSATTLSEDFIKESGSELSDDIVSLAVIVGGNNQQERFEELMGMFLALGRGFTPADQTKCAMLWVGLGIDEQIRAFRFAMESLPEWRTRPTSKIPFPWNYLEQAHWNRAAPRLLAQIRAPTTREEAHARAAKRFMEGD